MSVLSFAAMADGAALSARQDRVINFVYRALLWCAADDAEQRTEAVFHAAPELLAEPDLDDAGYRARLVTALHEHQRSCQTAIVHAAYLDLRDTAEPARAHVWDLLVQALINHDPPAAAVAAVTERTGLAAALVREQFLGLLRAVSAFTTHLPAAPARCACP